MGRMQRSLLVLPAQGKLRKIPKLWIKSLGITVEKRMNPKAMGRVTTTENRRKTRQKMVGTVWITQPKTVK
jgi:hypothetical protein